MLLLLLLLLLLLMLLLLACHLLWRETSAKICKSLD
jgi:hypothetical protein